MRIATSKLKTNPNNPRSIRKDQLEKLVKSLREFPEMLEARPIVVDPDFVVLGGNMRLKAAQEAGLKEVPVYIASWEEAKHKEFIIKDNLAFGEWDWDMLANEWDAEELGDWGLDVPLEDEPTEGLTDPDEIPDVPEEPTTKPGDLWILGDHRLLCGDSTKAEDVERLMDGEKADMVFTDPPYGVDYEGINNDDRKGLPGLLSLSFTAIAESTKAGSGIYIFHSDRCADIFHQIFREHFHFSSMIIWVKNSLTLSQTDYQSQHESCLYGWVAGEAHRFYGNRRQLSVWEFDKQRISGHTTPKPVDLIERALQNSSRANDMVLDLFLGSGSTLIACEKTNRKCYSMELDPKYVDVAIKRWEDFTGKKARLENEEDTFKILTQAH